METSRPEPKLIIGIGNPDKKYESTYHNVGFLFADYLTKNFPNSKILKSDTYMNESGKFVAKELKKSGVKPEKLLIAHDDSDIALGNYKLSFGRGAAGHHGIESIMTSLKSKEFWRLRIGIRPRNEKVRQKAEKFVLKKITAADRKVLETVFQKSAKEIL
jgi:peptidyl-tRNA hydrolase, PTH1 family